MTNLDLTLHIFEFLKKSNVQQVIVCAGARNAPLVMALQQTEFKIFNYFEERSAAFFALGLMKSSQKPVAILTTSGTAVAELLPAAIEATYQGLPLIIISADRPKAYRQTGAPQTIEQVGIFSDYVERVYDIDVEEKSFVFDWSMKKPIQINVCFDEPLLDQKSDFNIQVELIKTNIKKNNLKSIPISIQNPLIILSEISKDNIELVKTFLKKSKKLIYSEALSQLSHESELRNQILISSEILVKKAFKEKLFDSVIRIGGVPTLRFWRDLEGEFKTVPVFNFSEMHYTGLARESHHYSLDDLALVEIIHSKQSFDNFKELDRQLHEGKLRLIQKYPFSEPAFVKYLSEMTEAKPVYIGNSLPIRHWDSFAIKGASEIYANRGANGIDGQISTYLGWSFNKSDSFCFIGDLTAMYDLASLGLANQLPSAKRRIIVMNNFGGQIFQRVFKNELFINQHQIQFKNWAQMWNWDYQVVKSESDFKNILNQNHVVIELQPNAEDTKQFWNEWDQLCQKI